MELTREYFEQWLEGLKKIWLDKNLSKLEIYFDKIEKYYENPFSVGTNFYEVLNFWKEIKNQEIIKLEMDCVAVDGKIGIAHWFLKDKSGEYDGVYKVVFNKNLDCIEFRQWCESN